MVNLDILKDQLGVPSGLEEKTANGLTETLAKYRVALEEQSHYLYGAKTIRPNTKQSYMKHYTGFFSFLCRIGDYESLLVLHNRAPRTKIPCMNANSVALYMLFKTGEDESVLCNLGTQDPVMDINGESILCVDEWDDIGNVHQFLSAVSAAHSAINQGGLYKDHCFDCQSELFRTGASNGCFNHTGSSLFWRSGNPRNSSAVRDAFQECKKRCENHAVRSCYQLLPADVQAIRRALLNLNCLISFQYYCMILVAIHMFLRCDELCKLEFAHYMPELSQYRPDGICECIVFKVKGKTDKVWKFIKLYRCDEVPTLCPVRHVLLYVAIFGTNSKFFFPDPRNRSKIVTYHQFLRVVKDVFFPILGRSTTMTTHVFRKTGYLFALWGNGEFHAVRIAARHATEVIATSYAQDAQALRHIHLGNGQPPGDNVVPTWRENFIMNTENATLLHSRRVSEMKTLDQLAESFVGSLNESMPIRTQLLATIIPRLYTFQPVVSNVERIKLLIRPLQPNDQNEILTMFSTMSASIRNSIPSTISANQQSTIHQRSSIDNETRPRPSVSRRQMALPERIYGDNDLVGRMRLKELSNGIEKLQLLLTMEDEGRISLPHGLTKGAKAFYYSNLKPLQRCFANHCNSDCNEFLKRWKDKMGQYRFKSTCCDGRHQCRWR